MLGTIRHKTYKLRHSRLSRLPAIYSGDQRGVTGLETAIVMIAFVVVAAVFAFSVLSIGLLSAGEVEQTVTGAMAETSATLMLRGAVFAESNTDNTAIDTVRFTLIRAARSGGSVDLSSGGTVITYLDDDQVLNCTSSGTPSCAWSANWLLGSGALVDPGEQVEMSISLTGLSPRLGKYKGFTIQVRPNIGAVIIVQRTVPAEIKTITNLK
jgi:flagellin FlaB